MSVLGCGLDLYEITIKCLVMSHFRPIYTYELVINSKKLILILILTSLLYTLKFSVEYSSAIISILHIRV